MPAFRYKAISGAGEVTTGLLDAADAPEARLRLRGDKLRVVNLRHARTRTRSVSTQHGSFVDGWLRSRRSEPRAAFFDGLSTLLRSGLSLRRSLGVLGKGRRISKPAMRLVTSLEHSVSSGRSFDEAMASRTGWFDELDAAVVAAGMRHGELAPALSRLADRNRQSSELRTKIIAALSYPLLVLIVTGVVIAVLSTKTLPPIVTMLTDAEIAVPTLTASVIRVGTMLTSPATLGIALFTVIAIAAALGVSRRLHQSRTAPAWLARKLPAFTVMPMLASLARSIADLTATGVPLAESLRIAEPTLRGPCASHLRATVRRVRDRLEQGEDLADAFDDGIWFDPAFHRLLAVGQDAGELPVMLRRLADRNEAEAKRAVDRLASLLEPAAILMMSAVVGTVVLAAVLPLIRMQELL